jgi:hypothetical protein
MNKNQTSPNTPVKKRRTAILTRLSTQQNKFIKSV